MTTILGVGHDVVDIADLDRQLGQPGSRFAYVFSARERRQASKKGLVKGDGIAPHLAACWAGKECVVKAWTEALEEKPFPLDLDFFDWSAIEILSNSKGCPQVLLSEIYRHTLHTSLDFNALEASGVTPTLAWKLSLSHAGGLASGVAMLCGE